MYFLAELIEEHTSLTKRILLVAIRAELVLHVLLLLIDRGPFVPVVVGAVAHTSYLLLLQRYPFIAVFSLEALLSTGMQPEHA